MTFLKPIRDNCGDSMLNRPVSNIEERLPSEPKEGENIIYIKDHGGTVNEYFLCLCSP